MNQLKCVFLIVLQDSHCSKHSPSTPLTNSLQSHDFLSDTKPNLNRTTDYNTRSAAMMHEQNNKQTVGENSTNHSLDKRILIKTEPISEDTTSHYHSLPSPVEQRPPKPTSLIPGGKGSTGPPNKKRRRFSISASLTRRSSSYSDDAGDDLSLSAEDCISGVISTPHIRPLEEVDDVMTTPSPATTPTLIANKFRTKITRASSSSPKALANSSTRIGQETKNTVKGDLVQDLDDFTKVMEMVTKEQLAMERQATISTPRQQLKDPIQRQSPPRPILPPPPYYPSRGNSTNGGQRRHTPISQANYLTQQQQQQYPVTPVPRRMSLLDGPLEGRQLTRPHSLQMQKHPQQLTLSNVSPQVDSSQLLSPTLLSTPRTPGAMLGYVPMNTQPPHTPTTPLDHFSAISTQQLVQSPTQPGPFFPQNSYQITPNHSSPWPGTQRTQNSPQQTSHLPQLNPCLDTITSQKQMQGQAWGTNRPMSLPLPQFSNHYSVASSTTRESNVHRVPPTHLSTLSFNHHHTL